MRSRPPPPTGGRPRRSGRPGRRPRRRQGAARRVARAPRRRVPPPAPSVPPAPGRRGTVSGPRRCAASAAGGRRRPGRRDTRCRPGRTGPPWRASPRRQPACRCPRARGVARKLSSVRCVTACAVRHQTRATSAPVSVRTRSKLCTPVWSTMPPPEASGRSSQSSGDGSKRWFTTSARIGPSPSRRSRSARTTVFHRSVCAIRHGIPVARMRRTIATAPAPVVESGFSISRALRAAATASTIVAVEARWHHGDDPSHRRIGDQVAPVGVEDDSRASRACATPRSASRRLRATTRRSGTSARMWFR